MKKLKLPELLVLNAYWVGLSFKWNALHPIILPAVLLNFVPDAHKNTYLGLLTFVGLLLAMVIQPLAGAISDGWLGCAGALGRPGAGLAEWALARSVGGIYLVVRLWGGEYFVEYVSAWEDRPRENSNLTGLCKTFPHYVLLTQMS